MVGRPLRHPFSWRVVQVALAVPVVAFFLAWLTGNPGGALAIATGASLLSILLIENRLPEPEHASQST